MEREIFKQELVKFAKWYQMEEMQRKDKKLFTEIVDDYMSNVVLPQEVKKSVCDFCSNTDNLENKCMCPTCIDFCQ